MKSLEEVQQEIEAEFQKIENEAGETTDGEPSGEFNEAPTGATFDVDKVIFQLEKIGNKFIEQKLHKELTFEESDLKIHSEMLSFVLQKHVSLDKLKNTPEYALAIHSVVMLATFQKKYSELKESGKLNE